MAMRVINGERWFTPTALGNDKDPNPVRVRLKYPREGERRELKHLLSNPKTYAQWYFELLTNHVAEVTNYEGITTGGELYRDGAEALVEEVVKELWERGGLTDHEKKPLEKPQTSPSAEPANGTAKNAASSVLRSSEGVSPAV